MAESMAEPVPVARGGRSRSPLPSLWNARWLYLQWVRRDFTVRYRQSLLGAAWAVLQPALLLGVYGFVFVEILGVRAPHGSYISFAFSGLVPWTFLSNSVSWSMPSLQNASGIIRQVYFPRVLIPLAACGVVVVDLALSTAILLGVQLATTGRLYLSTLALVPLYLVLVLATAALSNVAAVLGAFIRDVRFALPLVLQLVFIATPIMYPASRVGSRYSWVVRANPLARLVEAVRGAVTAGRWPSVTMTAAALGASGLALLCTVYYCSAVEDRLPDLL